jgi:hypothetical protein
MMYEVGSFFGPVVAGGAMVLSPVYGLSIVVAAVAGTLFFFGLIRNHGR